MVMRGLSLMTPKLLLTSQQKSDFEDDITQPYIDMVSIHVEWSKIQPSDGETDFSIFDTIFDIIPDETNVTLGIHAANDTPPWLLDVNGGPISTLLFDMTVLAHHPAVPVDYPIPYTAEYAEAYISIHQAVATYFASKGWLPRVQGISVGWSHSGDLEAACISFPFNGSSTRYDAQWMAAGYSDPLMLNSITNGAQAIAKLFPSAMPIAPMLSPAQAWPRPPGTNNTTDFVECIGACCESMFGDYGVVASGLSLGQPSPWLMQMVANHGVTPMFQTDEGDQATWTPAQAQQALLNGVSAGADYIEIFSPLAADSFSAARATAREAIVARSGPF